MQRVSEDMHAWLTAIGAVCYGVDRLEYGEAADGVLVKFFLGAKLAAECCLGGRLLIFYDYLGSEEAKRLLGAFAIQNAMDFHYRREKVA